MGRSKQLEVLLIFSIMLRVPNANLVLDDNNIVFRKSPFSSAHPFVFSMPMFLLAFNCTICSIPTTPINGLGFTIETLKEEYILMSLLMHFFLFLLQIQKVPKKIQNIKYIHIKFNSKRLYLLEKTKSTIEFELYC